MEGQSLMDELFERIKILEEETKVLEKEYNDLDNEVQNKKVAKTSKRWLNDKEKEENQKKIDEYNQKLDNYKKVMDENLNFPTSEMAPATLKNPNFDESEILNFLKLVNDEHKRLTIERKKHLEKIEQSINLNK